MERSSWNQHLLADQDLAVWELFHENSKLHPYQEFPTDQAVVRIMLEMYESLDYPGRRVVVLPPPNLAVLDMKLGDALEARVSARAMAANDVTLEEMSALLHSAYGITRTKSQTDSARHFRTVPSGGALYPLEIFLHTAHLRDSPQGLFHYSAVTHQLQLLRDGDLTDDIKPGLVQQEIASGAAVLVFITALFERSVFKYGDRGYRFTLLEAGHMAQNIDLVATALGLPVLNVGGFFDNHIDEFLGLNGLTHSSVYIVAVSGKASAQ